MQARPSKTVTWQTLSLTTFWGTFRTTIVARKFVQDVGVLTIANFIGAALNFIPAILIARWLGPEQYGVVGLVMSYPSFIYAFFDARSVEASVKYLSEYHARGERSGALAMCCVGYAVDLAVASVTFLVVTFTARIAAESIVHDPAAAGLMVLYGAALIPRALVGTSNAILVTLGRFRILASIEIATTFLRVVLVVGLVFAGWQVAGVIWANAVAAAATGLCHGILAWVLIRRTWGASIFHGSLKALKGGRRQIFAFLAYNNLTALIGTIPNQLDVILLGVFRDPTEVGYYKLAKSISRVVRYLTKPLQTVTYPKLARLWASDHRRASLWNVRNLLIWIGLPLGVVVLLGAGFVPFILPLLVGEVYLPAVRATQLLIVGSAISLAFFWTRPVYLARGQVRQMFIISSSVTVGFALFYPFVIREWGYMGAAGWTLTLQIVATAISGSWLWKQWSEKDESPNEGA